MRNYSERCLRNLQDRMIIFGFEGWDIFIVMGVALTFQSIHMNKLILWLAIFSTAGFLYFIKRGKPSFATEHFIDWFVKEKKWTAIPQVIGHSIKGRGINIKLNSLQSILPYSHFEDDLLVFNDDSLSACYELICPSLDNFSSAELVGFSQRIETFLNSLTNRATYQVFFTLDSNYQNEIEEHKVITSTHHLIKSMHLERIKKLEYLKEAKILRRRRCYLFVNYSGSYTANKSIKFFNKFSQRKRVIHQEIDSLKHEIKLICQSVEDGLLGANFQFKELNKNQTMRLIYKYLNPDREKLGLPCPFLRENKSFVQQVCCSDLSIDETKGEYMQYGGFYHKYITLKVLPESTEPGMLDHIANMSFSEFDVIVNFEAPTKEWGRKKIESMRKREYGNMTGLFNIINKDAETKVAQYESLLEETQQNNQKLFRMQLTVHVYAQELEDVKKKTVEVIRVFSSLNGAEMHDERWGSVKPIFLSTLPGWTKESSRWILLKSLHMADFLPLFSEFRGSGRAECLFFNSTQGLASYDPFSDDLSAYNTVVIGASGSGKSFTINQLINQYSKNDPVEIFIDIGGSYKRQVILKNGEYIPLGLKEKFTINLFDLSQKKRLKDFREEEQNEILIIKTKTIAQMMGGLSRFKESDQIVEDYIFRSIAHLYQEVDYPELSDLKEALQFIADENKQLQPFYEPVVGLLGIWFRGGQYGKYTDGPSTISLDKSVICFDLKGLSQFERLQSVMLTIVTNFIWGKIMSEPKRRKFVIFDECWKLLNTPEAATFIAECYRTFRKYGAGAISVTQSLSDFLGSGLEDAILGNSNTRFILRQNSAPTVDKIVKYFNFNEQEKRLIESIQIKKGEYSEVFFSQSKELQNISSKMIIYPTPIEYWVATTDSSDLLHFQTIRDQFVDLSLYEVLEKCAEEFPHGVGQKNAISKGGFTYV
ncbi:MAG: ATP-binding protein [Candidatus Omnitrophica bacterium]|nr:ATP-binding protein [Candidatus Omnitrophota bacterium]